MQLSALFDMGYHNRSSCKYNIMGFLDQTNRHPHGPNKPHIKGIYTYSRRNFLPYRIQDIINNSHTITMSS